MKHGKAYTLVALFVVLVSTLACTVFNLGGETADESSHTNNFSDSAASDSSAEKKPSDVPLDEKTSTDKSITSPKSDIDAGSEFRSEGGGYAFLPIPEYEFEEFFGLTTMIAPDADPDLGPMLMLIGGANDEDQTSSDIFNNFIQDAERENFEILEQKNINVDGLPGLLANISGDLGGLKISGRIVVVAVTPTQQFTMFASAPQDRWAEFEELFNVVLDSIHFFEPQDIEFSGMAIENTPDTSENNSAEEENQIVEIPSLEEFPTESSQLPPGSFAYLLASAEGFPTIVTQGSIQDQSTSTEYIIGLISKDQNNILTLFIPLDIGKGVIPMINYDMSTASKAPGATVYIGETLYTNTDGIIMVDEMVEATITGSVYFAAVNQNGDEIAVTGFFNALPLVTP